MLILFVHPRLPLSLWWSPLSSSSSSFSRVCFCFHKDAACFPGKHFVPCEFFLPVVVVVVCVFGLLLCHQKRLKTLRKPFLYLCCWPLSLSLSLSLSLCLIFVFSCFFPPRLPVAPARLFVEASQGRGRGWNIELRWHQFSAALIPCDGFISGNREFEEVY